MSASATHSVVIRLKEGDEIFARLAVAFSDHRVFSAKHPRFLESCQSLLKSLDAYFKSHPEQPHVLFVHRSGQIYFRKMPLSVMTPPAIKLARLFQSLKIEGVRLSPTASLTGLCSLIESLHATNGESGETVCTGINRRLEAEGLKGQLGLFMDRELSAFEENAGELTDDEAGAETTKALLALPQLALPLELYKSTLTALHDLMSLIGSGGSPQFDPLLEVAGRIAQGVIDGDQDFLPLTTVGYTEQFTFNHSVNVCLLVTAALKPMVSNPEKLIQAGQAALLHDVGKSLVPQELFYTASVPRPDERAEIERHTALGAEILQSSKVIDPLTVVVAFDHHRRPNGKGYPRVKRERPTDIITALVAVADIYEALVAQRPYKQSLTPAEAFQVLLRLPEAEGLEPAARILFDAISPFPPGTLVELDTGELAVVTRARPSAPHTPCVRLIARSSNTLRVLSDEIDLGRPDLSGLRLPRVRKAVPPQWKIGLDSIEGQDAGDIREIFERRRDFEQRVSEGTLLASEG